MKRIKHFALGFLTASILSCGLVYASQISETVQRTFKDIKIVINGNEIIPKDASGNVVEPFIINGTTYLPVRAICEALGLEVSWNGNTNTVAIGNTVNSASVTTKITLDNIQSKIDALGIITEKVMMAFDMVGATDGIKLKADDKKLEIYVFDTDSDVYKRAEENQQLTMPSMNNMKFDAKVKNGFAFIIDEDFPQYDAVVQLLELLNK